MRTVVSIFLAAASATAQAPGLTPMEMTARARALELNTPYVPPPGDSLVHETGAYAKVVCSAVFVSGFNPEFAAENLGYVVAPYANRQKVGKPVVDRRAKTVTIALPAGGSRMAKYTGDQGCVAVPLGAQSPRFKPLRVKSRLPKSERVPWPMGDAGTGGPLPAGLNAAKVGAAVKAVFEPKAMTAAFVVTWKGRIIAERYGEGVTKDTPLESWSMGKSVSGTLMGILIQKGLYRLEEPAPIPEWQNANDPRRAIRVADLLHMSSGLRIKAPNDPDYDPKGPYSDHWYLYTGDENLFHYAATRPPQWPPNTVGRYRNTDPMLINYLIRLGVEGRKERYHAFPRRALFDKLGMRSMVLETDTYGNFLTQGYVLASGRDWARLGNLYLQDGIWKGERILPEGFVKFASTVAPAWQMDQNPEYGGFFWINGVNRLPIPKDAFFMGGAGNQFAIIVPSHDLVIVRLGHYKGIRESFQAFYSSLQLLMEAVPKNA